MQAEDELKNNVLSRNQPSILSMYRMQVGYASVLIDGSLSH